MMYYDEPEGCDGDMRQYVGFDQDAFKEPTDEEYRQAYAEYIKEQEESNSEGAPDGNDK